MQTYHRFTMSPEHLHDDSEIGCSAITISPIGDQSRDRGTRPGSRLRVATLMTLALPRFDVSVILRLRVSVECSRYKFDQDGDVRKYIQVELETQNNVVVTR